MTAGLAPVDQVLVLAARLELGPEAATFQALLQAGLPWDELVLEAGRFGVQGLLLRHLRGGFGALVPESALAQLEAGHRRVALRALRTRAGLQRALPPLAAAGIPVILLKGAALAQSLYGDPALRPMSDVDILIRPEDRAAAWEQLLAAGFTTGAAEGTAFNNPMDEQVALEHGHCPPLYLNQASRLEVHVNLLGATGRGGTALEDLWAASVPLEGEAGPARRLGPEHQFLHLAAHLQGHIRKGEPAMLYWFADLHELARAPGQGPDWGQLRALAQALGKEEALAQVEDLLRRHWGTPIPPGPAPVQALALAPVLAAARAFQPGRKDDPRLALNARLRLTAAWSLGGAPAAARLLAGLAFPGTVKLREVHGIASPAALAFWRAAHPFWQLGRFLGSRFAHVRPRRHP